MPKENLNKEKKDFDRGFLIGFIICLLVCSFISVIVVLQEIYGLQRDFASQNLLILTDAFTISGGLMLLFYLLVFVSDEGAFDMISYSIQLVWVVTFHKNVRETRLPKNYAEYRELKRNKPRLNLRFILFSGLIFFIIGIILLIIYHIN